MSSVGRLVPLLAVLAASAASASTCLEGPNVLLQCICGKYGYYDRQRGAVLSTDGGTTQFRIVLEPDQKYVGFPESITGPALSDDVPDASFLLFVGPSSSPNAVREEDRWEVKARLPIQGEQVQCVGTQSNLWRQIPYAIVADAGREPSCSDVLIDAGYGESGCPSCGCGAEPESSPFWVIAIALVTVAAQVARRGRRVT